jgi:serine/threonine protein kinase
MSYDDFGVYCALWPVQNDGQGATSRLGRYEILAPIGSGGMATIYLGRIAGPAGFEKPIALKVIHTHLSEDPQFVEMFFDEARIASQLQHPNIVQIFELGESQGTYFIAMEYLRGETVGAMVLRVIGDGSRRMDPRIACHVIMQAAEGLHYAHEVKDFDDEHLGLVHRDISPQNLFVTYSGSVKLMDFGIARAKGLAHSTRPGSLKGKFSYMSPEQVRGKEIDRRSDVFSLGVVLWESLAGKRLFKGRNDLESLRLVGEAKVVPVSQIRPGIPPYLDQVVAKALARILIRDTSLPSSSTQTSPW